MSQTKLAQSGKLFSANSLALEAGIVVWGGARLSLKGQSLRVQLLYALTSCV
ncbi:hypothetical protein Caka_3020 [Coraliomargarita akajimensis DSM 45221]|uniref:Uncharacterized protein n=1 Tax=Coraliomargarita akajimensis (strain DSM 45221 / IAM 15411 / JCM 23193 / KCTC 12865 / 04OKA010-24) TaxID=583355 RepID=D5EHZ3_CORAD|nr:hypothetical protein Caka_3020 [Coraliomargarita akajimensis DSM 45221]